MSTKSPQYIIKRVSAKPSFMRRYGGFLLFLLSVCFFICSYYMYSIRLDGQGNIENNHQNQKLKSELEHLNFKMAQLTTENKVKSEAITVLQKSLLESEQKQHELKTEVNFFESLLANNSNEKGLRVFKVQAEKKGGLIVLNLVLAQKITKAKEKTGTIDLKLKGIVADSSKTINLTKKYSLNRQFKFKYFQILNFSIKLPKDFNPTVLLVDLYSKDNKPKNTSQQFDWHEILQKVEE